ncbi:MAG: DUF4328 domain-containing protein [Acidimicrobiia bacterium]|nr:DUF4328 domain-containing protein [Acidimicrobiia bacterium]NDE79415.1 DUF4328 domain-containing protein [Actinomycetota bacterium]
MSDMNSGPDDPPSFPPPPPPSARVNVGPSAFRESLSVGLARWTFGLMIAAGIAAGLRGILALAVNQSMQEFLDTFSDESLDDFLSRADAYDGIDSVYSLLTLATFVLLIIFSFRSYKASQSLWSGPRKWSRGFSVGGWFIPFANFYIPPSLLIETDKISRATRSNGVVGDAWRSSNRDNAFIVWFALYGVGLVLASRISNFGDTADDFQDISDRLVVGAIGNGLICAGCIVGALALKRMATRLSPTSIG